MTKDAEVSNFPQQIVCRGLQNAHKPSTRDPLEQTQGTEDHPRGPAGLDNVCARPSSWADLQVEAEIAADFKEGGAGSG